MEVVEGLKVLSRFMKKVLGGLKVYNMFIMEVVVG